MTPNDALLIALFLPVIGAFGIMLTGRWPNIREGLILTMAVTTFLFVLMVAGATASGAYADVTLFEVMPGLSITFKLEPLGAMFAVIASGLYIVNSLYSIGYMRGNKEKNQTRFYVCFALAISAALGIAFAGNLLTFFTFYEILTLSTFPLVTHKQDEKARAGGRIYLGILMGTSIGLLLPAIVWTWVMTGTTDFMPGGILSGVPGFSGDGIELGQWIPPVLLGLYLYGIGKAALMPIHPWLPNAMVAPTPVSAFLHAVAVVKAGVFGVLKITIYTFGIDTLSATGAGDLFMWIAALSILLSSAIAMTQDNLKARLAYSTISQLSYVTLGAMIATNMGVMGGAMQIAAHALGKMTLFMCAGAIYVAHHKSLVSEMRGLGRLMPFTFGAFFIGAMSIVGLPPMAGSWPKFFLMLGAVDAGHLAIIAVLIISSLLNVIYLLSIPVNAFFGKKAGEAEPAPIRWKTLQEAPILCLVPPLLTAAGTLILFFYSGPLYQFLSPLIGGAG